MGGPARFFLPHVIRYNGSVPTKLAVWPKYEEYQCDKKYLDICQMLGLKAETPEEATNVLADAVMALGKDVGIDMNFQSLVPDEKLWESNLEKIAYLAYEDQCTPANPREPLVREMEQIMRDAYKGN
jgi:acetaldehyde dehydrogenase/alcohol dehydrogenase